MIVDIFGTDGQAVLSCTTQADWTGNVIDPTITASSVNSFQVAPAGACVDEVDPDS